METEKYQGWTNYETWKLALNIDNDEGLYNESRAIVRGKGKITGEQLKSWVESISEDMNTKEINEVGIKLSDFWSWNEWREVNFEEIAKSINPEEKVICEYCKINKGEIETDRGVLLCNSCDCERLSCINNTENPRTEEDFWGEIRK